jgi:SAM-dependent methyltransferase
MSKSAEFEQRYQKGEIPWDTGEHDSNLDRIIGEYSIAPCPVLELGAGTGTDAVWLAEQGFDVTAVDVSPTAVEKARQKASERGVNIRFITADILRDDIPGDLFDFVFDRGCFHVFDLPWERARVAEIIWTRLNPGGYWFSIMGSTDGPPRKEGPPRRSILDIAGAVEAKFEIIQIRSILMHTKLPEPPRGWACLMRRREMVVSK